MNLTDFLLARISEDEALIEGDWSNGDGGLHIISSPMYDRLLAECEAKRRIVEEHPGQWVTAWEMNWWACGRCGTAGEYDVDWPCLTLRFLALPYADHPDYREEWKP